MAMKVQQGINSFLNDVYESGEYRVRVSSEPAAPLAGNNPSIVYDYTDPASIVLTQTMGGRSYQQTITIVGTVATEGAWIEI